ncbi:ATPase V [candidate division KSB1 bacterium]|nr:ATPase V [candidate division KSB1 bacterium]
MFSRAMIRLFGIVIERDADALTRVLLRQGVLHMVEMANLNESLIEHLMDVQPQVSRTKATETRKRIDHLLASIGITPAIPENVKIQALDESVIDGHNAFIDKITRDVENIRTRQQMVHREILKFKDIQNQVQLYGLQINPQALKSRHSFINLNVGRVTKSHLPEFENKLKEFPAVILTIGEEDEYVFLLLISIKRDWELIQNILTQVGWQSVELPDQLDHHRGDIIGDIEEKLAYLNGELEKLEEEAHSRIVRDEKQLTEFWIRLRTFELFCRVQAYFKKSKRTVLFTGWLPLAKKDVLEEEIYKATNNNCYLEWLPASKPFVLVQDNDTAPTQLSNPKLFEPFQMLVTNYGIPQYGTIDPTPVVVLTYLSMFGLMFADAGQGLVIALAGFLGRKISKFKKLATLLIWCGFSATVFGILFGSYFGMPWFRPVWLDFHGIVTGHVSAEGGMNGIFDILKITVIFGISVIGLGLAFNWINLIRRRKWFELLLDRGGFLGGWVYAAGIYTAWYLVDHDYRSLPPTFSLVGLLGLPALLFFLKEPLHFFSRGKKFYAMKLVDFIMEWIVELLEVFSGYLSNTLSFMRVAGLGIAHVSLMMAFSTIARMLSGPDGGFSVWAILVFIFGNILVILLEGLSAGIQALRLNYYEFFTKFFHGTGRLFSPISLKTKD